MNFNFMLILVFVILIFIKTKIKIINNYVFLIVLGTLLLLNELYNTKNNSVEQYHNLVINPRHGKFEIIKSFINNPNHPNNELSLLCEASKVHDIKQIQDNRLNKYKGELNKISKFFHGNKDSLNDLDEIVNTDVSNNINRMETIDKRVCPSMCHTIKDEQECRDALYLPEALENEDVLKLSKESLPVFKNYKFKKNISDCTKITTPTGGALFPANFCSERSVYPNKCRNPRSNELINTCVYDRKKCDWNEAESQCSKKCEFYKDKITCNLDSNSKCIWNGKKCVNNNACALSPCPTTQRETTQVPTTQLETTQVPTTQLETTQVPTTPTVNPRKCKGGGLMSEPENDVMVLFGQRIGDNPNGTPANDAQECAERCKENSECKLYSYNSRTAEHPFFNFVDASGSPIPPTPGNCLLLSGADMGHPFERGEFASGLIRGHCTGVHIPGLGLPG